VSRVLNRTESFMLNSGIFGSGLFDDSGLVAQDGAKQP
jgi:hypothetical protein